MVDVTAVESLRAVKDGAVDLAIDSPQPGENSPTHVLRIAGRVNGGGRPVGIVELTCEGKSIRKAMVGRDGAFESEFGTVGLPPECEVTLRALSNGAAPIPLASVKLKHAPVATGFSPSMQPLMVTSLFRTGTTRLMRLLSEHSGIAIHKIHPYETRVACYWMHVLKVLSEPADFLESCQPDNFRASIHWAGNNPFNRPPVTAHPALREWMGGFAVERLAAFCQSMSESFYTAVASAQGQGEPHYFAEKHVPDNHHAWLLWEIYPEAREIFLIRDFRDMVCSILAFNKKRGYASFGRDRVASDADFVRLLGSRVANLLRTWKRRSPSAHLVRYESLVRDPATALFGVLEYLDLDPSPEQVEELLERADAGTAEAGGHCTATSPAASIGRWRRELDADMQALCNECFGEALAWFGYT